MIRLESGGSDCTMEAGFRENSVYSAYTLGPVSISSPNRTRLSALNILGTPVVPSMAVTEPRIYMTRPRLSLANVAAVTNKSPVITRLHNVCRC